MIVAGFGFRRAASEGALADAFERARDGRRVDRLAAPADKAAAPALRALARALDLPVEPVPADTLRAQATLTNGAASRAARGTGSVAEAAALAGAGPGARLAGPRAVSSDATATCAIAIGASS